METIVPSTWFVPPLPPALSAAEVHLWRAVLDVPHATFLSLEKNLDPQELARAGRFCFKVDQRRYIVAHGILRSILSHYLGAPAAEIQMTHNAYGKPRLAGDPEISFNLSHSNNLLVLAFARGRELGIDVEYIRPELFDMQVAHRYFASREFHALQSLPPHLRQNAFFECWTRKEAYIKARGEGLSIPLDEFEVSFLPDEPLIVLQVYGNPAESCRWSIQSLNPCPGYVVALVVEGFDWKRLSFEWHPGLLGRLVC